MLQAGYMKNACLSNSWIDERILAYIEAE